MITKEEMDIKNIIRYGGKILKIIDNQTERVCLEAVNKDGMALQFVKDQTEKICVVAVRNNGMALQFVKDQTEKICVVAVRNNGMALQFVKDQTEKICCEAIITNPDAAKFIKNMTSNIKYILNNQDKYSFGGRRPIFGNSVSDEYLTYAGKIIKAKLMNIERCEIEYSENDIYSEEQSMEIVKRNGLMLRTIVNQTEKICIAAIEQNPLAIQFVYPDCMTDAVKLRAVQKNSEMLQYIDKQTEHLCLEAVKKNPDTISLVNPECMTDTIKIEAVVHKPSLLQHIDQNVKVCIAAIEQNPLAIQFVKNKTKKICEKAVRLDGNTLKYIDNQTDDLCKTAIECNPLAIQYVQNKTKELCELAVNKYYKAIMYIPEEYQTKEMCETVFKEAMSQPKKSQRQNIFKYIANKYKSREMCMNAITCFTKNNNIENTKYIPPELIDKEMADFVFFKMKVTDFIRFIPEKYISYRMCKTIDNEVYFKYIPEKILSMHNNEIEKKFINKFDEARSTWDKEQSYQSRILCLCQKSKLLCTHALNQSIDFIKCISYKYQTDDMINKALTNPKNVIYIDPDKLSDDLLLHCLEKYDKNVYKHIAGLEGLSDKVYDEIIDTRPNFIKYMKNPSKEVCVRATKRIHEGILVLLDGHIEHDEVYLELLKNSFKQIMQNVDESRKKSILKALYSDITKENMIFDIDVDIIKDLKELSDNIKETTKEEN